MTHTLVACITATQTLLIDEHLVFSFDAFCRASGANGTQVHALVEEGLLHPSGAGPLAWQFTGPSVKRARTALRLARELELSLHAAAIVMDLLDEIDVLRRRRYGAGTPRQDLRAPRAEVPADSG